MTVMSLTTDIVFNNAPSLVCVRDRFSIHNDHSPYWFPADPAELEDELLL